MSESDAGGGGVGITQYQFTTSSNAIVINAVSTTNGTPNNYVLWWRAMSADGDQ